MKTPSTPSVVLIASSCSSAKLALDLHEQTNFFVGLLEIVLDATKITGAARG